MKQNNLFEKQVRLALSNFDKAEWLGEHSPLATPYFLGHLLESEPESAHLERRGDCLKQLLLDSAAILWGGSLPENRETLVAQAFEARDRDGSKCGKFGFLLLELYFFRKYFPSNLYPQQKVEPIIAYTASSRTRFFGYLNHFIPQLATRVKELAQPSFRLEHPQATQISSLIGRDKGLDICLNSLQNSVSVNLNGPGGIGKTSLGIEISNSWSGPAFWYTIRPGLNDNPHSLLFSLGHYLNLQDRSTLWLQLLADSSKVIDFNLVMGCLREDLSSFEQDSPLFCFDEIDLLGNIDGRTSDQQMIVEIFDHLHKLAPTLFIGQHALIDTPKQVTLDGLQSSEIAQMLSEKVESQIVEKSHLTMIFDWTKGNPRFVELVAALLNRGVDWSDVKVMMGQTLAGRPILERLWKRLSANEQKILGYLSVFRREVPTDPFLHLKVELDHLAQIGVISFDLRGNLTLFNMFGGWIRNTLQPEQLENYHNDAAILRAERGEFSESAWHYYQNQAFENAIEVWFPHRQQELSRGHAISAREIFQNISLNKVGESSREKLKIIRAELNLLLGLAEHVVSESDIEWRDSPEKAEYLRLLADAHFMLGNHDMADRISLDGIASLAKQSHQSNQIRFIRVAINLREGEIETAEKEVHHAEYQSNLMRALLLDHQGKLDDAARALQGALELAEQLEDGDAIAKTKRELAINFGRRGDMVHAEYYSNEAMSWYKKKGDRLSLEGTRANLAGMYLQTGEFEKVIENGIESLKFFERIKNINWISSLSYNIAEAYYELDELELAQSYAHQAMRTEDGFIQPYSLYTLGLIDEKQENFSFAGKKLAQGLEIAEQNGDMFIAAYLQRAMGSLCGKVGEVEKAAEHLSLSQQIFSEMSLTDEANATEEILKKMQLVNA